MEEENGKKRNALRVQFFGEMRRPGVCAAKVTSHRCHQFVKGLFSPDFGGLWRDNSGFFLYSAEVAGSVLWYAGASPKQGGAQERAEGTRVERTPRGGPVKAVECAVELKSRSGVTSAGDVAS